MVRSVAGGGGHFIDFVGLFEQWYLPFGLMYELSVNLGADRHFDQIVIHIANDTRGRPKFHPLAREDVAPNDPVQHDIRHRHAAGQDAAQFATKSRRVVCSCILLLLLLQRLR